ncbi:hypothetical protein CPIN18020_0206 [Campylobacter pinnipediorum subsp. caledonicus]|uniref:hypothetical protein n=1 Tax=Campylobacter pinnipediorum TaxID=1965231 RepID=UPI0009958C8A|nr:hypothetical protein [Campylobacter pinnipediorum]AQW85453.1 hypothetical protein CPIN18020_0206 [Campylobacter pinnipediorum subsp. caledonicus]
MKNDKVKFSLEKFLKNPSNNFSISGNNNNQIIGENININHYTLSEKPKVIKVIEDHQYNGEIHISKEQQQNIRNFVEDIATMMGDYEKINYYKEIFTTLKNKFKVPKYSLIPKDKYNEVKKFLYIQRSINRKKLKLINAKRFKQYTIDAIIKNWDMLNMDIKLCDFANIKLNKKITSIDKLSVNDIDNLYNKVMYQKNKKEKKDKKI